MKTKLESIKVVKEWQLDSGFVKVFVIIYAILLIFLIGSTIENSALRRELNSTQKEIASLKVDNARYERDAKQALCLMANVDPIVTYIPMEVSKSEPLWSESDVAIIAQTLWGECRGCSKLQQSGVVWCILNRVDSDTYPNNIEEVVTTPMEFQGYSPTNPIDEELVKLVEDVLHRWQLEKFSVGSVGRTLPKDYLYFVGNGKVNLFSKEFKSTDYWDWSLGNPYV